MSEFDVAIVGGGMLGAAFGWGLARAGQRCVVFDEGDSAVRTARGNFGLVWVQSKGRGMPDYAAWSLKSSQLWSGFARELLESTGIDVHYQRGGFDIAADDAELEESTNRLRQISAEMGDRAYRYEILDHAALKSVMPHIGAIPGATFTEHDGHCNPLLLLRALHQDMQAKGASYRALSPIAGVEALDGGGYQLFDPNGRVLARAGKVIIAAGHGSTQLTKTLGIDLPIYPDQGQVLVTEKVEQIMPHASSGVRQTDNGSFLLGASSKNIGIDLRTDLATLATIAERCIRIFPFLGSLRLQRAWAALRVMTPDGCPVYQQSEAYPGVFSFACHSGVTLAACHAMEVAQWVVDGTIPTEYEVFHPRRFDV